MTDRGWVEELESKTLGELLYLALVDLKGASRAEAVCDESPGVLQACLAG